jgi:hypothetical protein
MGSSGLSPPWYAEPMHGEQRPVPTLVCRANAWGAAACPHLGMQSQCMGSGGLSSHWYAELMHGEQWPLTAWYAVLMHREQLPVSTLVCRANAWGTVACPHLGMQS